MTDAHLQDLIRRVPDFQFEESDQSLTFAARLAREQGWSRAFAERAILEYKRFAILAVCRGPVSPSEVVDQVWHLHLTYTRSYWTRFCKEVLQAELHHEPTKGGPAEFARHFGQYSRTLREYEEVFGEVPPDDIWPEPRAQFQQAGAGRWVDPSRYWIIPKRPRKPVAILSIACLIWLLNVSAANVPSINPFDLNSPQFVWFYGGLMGITLLALVILRFGHPFSHGEISEKQIADDPYLSAALAHGPRAVTQAALVKLVHEGHLVIEFEEKSLLSSTPPKVRILRGEPLPAGRPEIEQAVFATTGEKGYVKPKELFEATIPAAKMAAEPLNEMELIDAPGGILPHRFVWFVLLGVECLGVVRLMMGLAREKPVGYLFAMLLFGGMMLIATAWPRRLTPYGRSMRHRLLNRIRPLERDIAKRPDVTATDMALCAGLFAIPHVAAFPHFQALHRSLKHDGITGKKSYFGDSSGGHFGCGGGGCGGGGCGGGGCGGCGGCGG